MKDWVIITEVAAGMFISYWFGWVNRGKYETWKRGLENRWRD